MKIVDRNAFLALPPGTVFSKYAPAYFESLSIKGDTVWHVGADAAHDFWFQQIEDAIACADFTATMCEYKEGQRLEFDFECETRDGLFERGQLFAVWGGPDVMRLIKRLWRCLPAEYQDQAP